MDAPRHKHPPPWLFGIVGIPYGVGGAFVAVVMPFLASRAKIEGVLKASGLLNTGASGKLRSTHAD